MAKHIHDPWAIQVNITSSLRTALSRALSVILPSPEDTLLLRACLVSGESAKRACEAWLREHQDGLKQDGIKKEAIKAFLPLLFHTVRNHSIEVDAALLTILRTAAVREKLRTEAYNSICRELFSLLVRNGIPMIVLAGAALAETVYIDPALRHSHDIDLLIPEEEIGRAGSLLPVLGFKPLAPFRPDLHQWNFRHASAVPLGLHSRLFEIPYGTSQSTEVWARSQNHLVSSVAARILSPADSLLYVCGQAAYSSSRHSLRWVSDAWFIIDRYPDLDWELLLDCGERAGLALPLSVMLGYLSEHFDARIPSSFLERLQAAAARSDMTTCEAALYAVIATAGKGLGHLVRRVPNWRDRALLIKWMLFPSPSYFVRVWKIDNVRLLPLYYVYRPLRYAAYRLSSRLKVLIQCMV